MYRTNQPEKVASFKPEKEAYTPPQRQGNRSAIEFYLDRHHRFSKDLSESRRKGLHRRRNLDNFAVALFPYIEERYDKEMRKNIERRGA